MERLSLKLSVEKDLRCEMQNAMTSDIMQHLYVSLHER